MTSIAVVINPVSGGGRGKKAWNVLMPGLHAIFDNISYRMSNQVDDVKQLTRDLLREEPDYFLIIGGDGTLSHAVNGLLESDKLINSQTRYAYFNSGCGGDFARQFPRQRVTEFLDRLIHHQVISCNVGKISFSDQRIHYFINIASCGLSAHVVSASANSKWLKKFGGGVNYFVHALLGLVTYRKVPVHIQFDNNPPIDGKMFLMAVCNGQYFGGRMHVAPMAKIDDDLLDVVVVYNLSRLSALLKFFKIYSGNHLLEKKIHYIQAKTVTIKSDESLVLPVEADGELVGQLPARFELLAEKLELIL